MTMLTRSSTHLAFDSARPGRPRSWRWFFVLLCGTGLGIYLLAICLDLPAPAGLAYRQNLPDTVLASWGATAVAQPMPLSAVHWWDKAQGLRGWSVYPEGWEWSKITPAALPHWLPIVLLAIVGIGGLRWLERAPSVRVPWLALTALVVFAYAFELAALWLKSNNVEQFLADRVIDVDFTGYLTSALHTQNISALFANYDRTIHAADWCNHCRTHPPGPVLFFWLCLHAVNLLPTAWQQAMIGMLPITTGPSTPPAVALVATGAADGVLFVASAFVIPLYGLARRLASPRLALSLAALGAVVPAMVLMSPEFDQVYGTLAAALLYLVVRGVQEKRHYAWWGLAAGLLFAFCTYWSFGMVVLAGPAVLLMLGATLGAVPARALPTMATAVSSRLPLRSAARLLLGFGVGAGLPWLLVWTIGGFRLLSVAEAIRQAQLGGITAVRPFAPWLAFNIVDYLQFLGLPLSVATLLTLVRQRERWLNVFGLLFWGMLLALDISGTTRAEVGRLWIPLTPLALMAIFHASGRGWLTLAYLRVLLIAQFVVCSVIGGNWLTP